MSESVVIKCYDLVESGAMDGDEHITEARLLHEAIAVMDTETKTKFMNKLIEIEKKAFPDDQQSDCQ